jgi:hypothetical protein
VVDELPERVSVGAEDWSGDGVRLRSWDA